MSSLRTGRSLSPGLRERPALRLCVVALDRRAARVRAQPCDAVRVGRERLERGAERLRSSPPRRGLRAPPPPSQRRPGRSGATTASPAIRYSKSLFGAESSAFRVSGRSKSSPTWWPWSAVDDLARRDRVSHVTRARAGRRAARARALRASSGSREASAARSARAGPPRAGPRAGVPVPNAPW